MSNRLKRYINIDVYLSATIYHLSTFCISYLKVVILLQDSLKNCVPDFPTASFSKDAPIKFALLGYQFSVFNNKSPFYSQIKHDIKNLKYSLVVTDVRRNQANWPIDKEAESFEIMP